MPDRGHPRQLPAPRDGLPLGATPRVAAYARGPLILDPAEVRASEWKWRNATAYTVTARGHEYRAIRVYSEGLFIGYWAVELLGVPMFELPAEAP